MNYDYDYEIDVLNSINYEIEEIHKLLKPTISVPCGDSEKKERRERIATQVLAGFAASGYEKCAAAYAAEYSIEWADALIKELDKAE